MHTKCTALCRHADDDLKFMPDTLFKQLQHKRSGAIELGVLDMQDGAHGTRKMHIDEMKNE